MTTGNRAHGRIAGDKSDVSSFSLNRRLLLKSGAGAIGAGLIGRHAIGGRIASAQDGAGEPAAARPRSTWLLPTADAIRPERMPIPGMADIGQVWRRQTERTAADVEEAIRWGTGPAPLPWTNVALDLIDKHRISPPRAARALALLHTAMADAVTAAHDAREAYKRATPQEALERLTPIDGLATDDSTFPSVRAMVAGAAAETLAALFPDEPAGDLEALGARAADSRITAGLAYPVDVEVGLSMGKQIAQFAIARASDDGASLAWSGERPEGEGTWQPTPPAYLQQPLEPMAANWRTWLVPDVVGMRPSAPPAWGSPAWRAQVAAVREAVARRTPEQEDAVLRWAGSAGTVSPAGLWIEIARDLVTRYELDDSAAARALAVTSVAIADAFVCCWDAKYAYWYARPVTADPSLFVLIPTPPFPSYTSGHSTIAAAAATSLAHLFPADQEALLAQAFEAKQSRLWAGIHYPIDNEVGAAMGDAVGRLVIHASPR